MNINIKKAVTVVVIGMLIISIAVQGRAMHREMKQFRVPTKESRKVSKLGTYKYMSVDDLAKRYNVTEGEIFNILKIKPEVGDEKLTLDKLGKKYGKTQEEMRKNTKELVEFLHKRGKKK